MAQPIRIKAELLLPGDRIKADGEWFTVSGLHGLRAATWVGVDVRERTYGMQFRHGERIEYMPFQRAES